MHINIKKILDKIPWSELLREWFLKFSVLSVDKNWYYQFNHTRRFTNNEWRIYCKLSSSEISFSFFGRSVFYFEQIIWSTSFRSLILLLLAPPEAPSNSSFFTLIQTLILKNSQPEPTDFFWLMTLFNIYSAKEF